MVVGKLAGGLGSFYDWVNKGQLAALKQGPNRAVNGTSEGELVLVDAHVGAVVLHFNQVDTARVRKTYDAGNGSGLPGTLRRSEGQGPIGDSDVDKAHDYAGDTYDFYKTTHGRDSVDDFLFGERRVSQVEI